MGLVVAMLVGCACAEAPVGLDAAGDDPPADTRRDGGGDVRHDAGGLIDGSTTADTWSSVDATETGADADASTQVDAGEDSGRDARMFVDGGADSGRDARMFVDGGADSGRDARMFVDGGADSGRDARMFVDGGADSGRDAGVPARRNIFVISEWMTAPAHTAFAWRDPAENLTSTIYGTSPTFANGVFFRFGWSFIQSARPTHSDPAAWTETDFDFARFDAELARAADAGRRIELAVAAGAFVPEWMCPSATTLLAGSGVTAPFDSADMDALDARLATMGFPHCKFVVHGARDCAVAANPRVTPVPWHPTYLAYHRNLFRVLAQHVNANPSVARAVRVIKVTGTNVETAEVRIASEGGLCVTQNWGSRGYSTTQVHNALTQQLDNILVAFDVDPHAPPGDPRLFASALVQDAFPGTAADRTAILLGGVSGGVSLQGYAPYCYSRLGQRCVAQNNFLNNAQPIIPFVQRLHDEAGLTLATQTNESANGGVCCFTGNTADPSTCGASASTGGRIACADEPSTAATFLDVLENGFCQDVAFFEIFPRDARDYPVSVRLADDATRTLSCSG